jgi:malate dehydrogenase (oxaloacetate-decarboxylating)(NADP+)
MIDVGTNNQKIRCDPLYIGLKEEREKGEKYDQLIDEFMEAVVRRYGKSCLIQFEDFGNHNAFRLLEKYRGKFCTFNDDIQGTAAVAVAGIIASLNITKKKLMDNLFVFQGAGEASIGIAKLLCKAIMATGVTETEALSRIWLVDSRGLIVQDRPKGGVVGEKLLFAKKHAPIDSLEKIIESLKPTAIIGAAAIPGAFTEPILKFMGKTHEHPIIFALSNPTSKAECTAEQAYTATEGKAVFASGSPFSAVEYKGKTFHPGQGNNAYIFPGLALAIIAADIRSVTEEIFLASAQSLAKMITKENLDEGRVYPPLREIRNVSLKLAEDIINYAYENNLAYRHPKPKDVKSYLEEQLYDTDYASYIPPVYSWPESAMSMDSCPR